MPALSVEITNFLTAVTDKLTYGQNTGARASTTIGSGANGTVYLTALNPGTAGNAWTIAVTVPAGTAGLTVSLSGTDITVALAVNTGVPVTASNTANLVAAALLGNATIAANFAANVSGTGASSLSTAVTKKNLTGGVAQDTNYSIVGRNYLRSQDMATVFELFQNAISNPSVVTATNGSTTTAVVTSMTAHTYVGAKVTFALNTTTAALRGVTAYVKDNTTTTFTFTTTLPAAVANTDTFTIQQTLLDSAILELRGPSHYNNETPTLTARSRGDSPPGEVYGFNRTVLDALQRLCQQLGGALPTKTQNAAALAVGTGSTTTAVVLNYPLRIDQFKQQYVTIGSDTRRIKSNDETTLYLSHALSSAPTATTAITIFPRAVGPARGDSTATHPGAQPGKNAILAGDIQAAQALVVAFTAAA